MSRGSVSLVAAALLAIALGACSSSSPRVTSETPSTSSSSSSPPSSRAATTTTTAAATRGAQWTTYYGDNARHGVSSDGPTASAAKLAEKWTSPRLDGDVYAQPLVVGSRVIIATEHDTVYALSLADGHVLWQ